MHGIGIHTYSDGVTYQGQFESDKKKGFGLYIWRDGREYEGWWHEGKQHGLGIYKDSGKGKIKHGIWEHGQRLSWFNSQTIEQINNMQYDYSNEFRDDTSASFMVDNATFARPKNFNVDIKKLK